VLRRASNPIDFDDGGAEEEGTSFDEEDDDLDFSGGGSGVRDGNQALTCVMVHEHPLVLPCAVWMAEVRVRRCF